MSVKKRSWKTKSGEARAAFIADYLKDGRRHHKQFSRKRDAENWLAAQRVEIATGIHTPDRDSITIAEAGVLWLAACVARDLEPTTINQYRQHLNFHIIPLIGASKLNAISGPTVRAFEDALRAGGRSPAMVRKARASLGSLLADAVDRGLSARNAVRDSRSRRHAREDRRRRRLEISRDIPDRSEVAALLRAAPERWRPFFMVTALCGLRASELRALRWSDVDLRAGYLHVRQRADYRRTIGRPKSLAGERSVPIPPACRDALDTWRASCPPGPLDLVFPTDRGTVQGLSNIVRRVLHPTWIAAGVITAGKPKYTGMHSLRHFAASWMLNRAADGGLGLSLKQVQERLGHATLQMTADTYGHLFPANDAGELAAGEAALLRS